jgi:hypothetical protein
VKPLAQPIDTAAHDESGVPPSASTVLYSFTFFICSIKQRHRPCETTEKKHILSVRLSDKRFHHGQAEAKS